MSVELSFLMNIDLTRKKIRKLLKEKKLSVRKAEKLCGLGPTVLRAFLTGRTQNPKIETLAAFARVLEVEPSELIETPNKIMEQNHPLPWKGDLFLQITSIFNDLLKEKGKTIENSEALPTLIEIYYTLSSSEDIITNKSFIELFFKKAFKEIL